MVPRGRLTQGASRQVYMASSPHIVGARTWAEGGNVSHAGRSITALLPGPVVNRIELIQLCQELGRTLTNGNSQSHMSRTDTSCFALRRSSRRGGGSALYASFQWILSHGFGSKTAIRNNPRCEGSYGEQSVSISPAYHPSFRQEFALAAVWLVDSI